MTGDDHIISLLGKYVKGNLCLPIRLWSMETGR